MRKLCQGYGKPKKGPLPRPMRERVDFVFKDEAAHVKALMRHRERRRDIQIAENMARHKKEDQRLAGLR